MMKLKEYILFGFKLIFADHYTMTCVKIDKKKNKSSKIGTAWYNSDPNKEYSEEFFSSASDFMKDLSEKTNK